MAKNYEVLEVLKENITLSAANTYTEVDLTFESTEIGKRNTKGDKIKVMLVHGIGFEIVSGFDPAATATDGDDLMIQFTTNSESAEVETIDKDCFYKKKWENDFVTGGHDTKFDKTPIDWFPHPLPYIKKRLWVGGDSTGLAAAADVNFTIYHTLGS